MRIGTARTLAAALFVSAAALADDPVSPTPPSPAPAAAAKPPAAVPTPDAKPVPAQAAGTAPVSDATPVTSQPNASVPEAAAIPAPTVPQTTAPAVPQAAPTVPQAAPTVPQTTAPAVPQTAPAVPQTAPAVPQAAPTVPQTAPAVPQTAAPPMFSVAPAPKIVSPGRLDTEGPYRELIVHDSTGGSVVPTGRRRVISNLSVRVQCESSGSPAVLVFVVSGNQAIPMFVPVTWQGDGDGGRTKVFAANVSPDLTMNAGEFMTLTLQFLGKGRCNGELSVVGREFVAPPTQREGQARLP